ncbi:MAG: hypothetical protein ABH816_01415 [Candidatus Levyibacteriota bacterium]
MKPENNSGKGRELFGNNKIFPSISRVITETSLKRAIWLWLIILVITLNIAFLICIGFVGLNIYQNFQKKEKIALERQKIAKEIIYWKNITDKYSDYRDGYFQLAVLEYKLGDIKASKQYLEKTLELDPNFEEGRRLEKLIK